MSMMIDRMARAIYEQRNGSGAVPWSRRDAAHKAPYLKDALAVLPALRELDEGMLLAMDRAFERHNKRQHVAREDAYAWRDECRRIEFTAAIDHILTSGAGETA